MTGSYGGPLSRLPMAHFDADSGRGTMSLLSNKPLRVANHCATSALHNVMLESQYCNSDQRMIKN